MPPAVISRCHQPHVNAFHHNSSSTAITPLAATQSSLHPPITLYSSPSWSDQATFHHSTTAGLPTRNLIYHHNSHGQQDQEGDSLESQYLLHHHNQPPSRSTSGDDGQTVHIPPASHETQEGQKPPPQSNHYNEVIRRSARIKIRYANVETTHNNAEPKSDASTDDLSEVPSYYEEDEADDEESNQMTSEEEQEKDFNDDDGGGSDYDPDFNPPPPRKRPRCNSGVSIASSSAASTNATSSASSRPSMKRELSTDDDADDDEEELDGKTRQYGGRPAKNKRLFACPLNGCGKTFTRRYNLTSHIRCHSGRCLLLTNSF